MRLLAIETSGKTGEFAVLSDGELLSESSVDVAGRLVERGIGEVDGVLAAAGITLKDLDAIAVSMGPGSFTGLRVGLAMAKGVCFRREIPLVGVPTLDALAGAPAEARTDPAGFIVPVIDARRGEIYLSIYRSDGPAIERITDYLALKPEAAVDLIRRECVDSAVLLVGDAIKPYGKVLSAGPDSGAGPGTGTGSGCQVRFAPEEAWRVRAAVVGRIGLSLLAGGGVLDAASAEPMYIRPSEAERRAGRGQPGRGREHAGDQGWKSGE
jgi:tRNA threonylcarbamoyladenosine biosynthesis protein TsaB